MILFYFDRNHSLPNEESLLAHRSKQISAEIKECMDAHAKACNNPLIPSGKTHYLMRALAHMVITQDQVYNRGGLIAIMRILENPVHKVSIHLQPEHLDHILIVIYQILRHNQFDALFQRPIRVHPGLEDAIRLDMKLPPKEPVCPVYVLRDCLMALFADIRQLDAPNCYAISALIYATENHPYKILSKTIQWLEQGYVTIGMGNTIPIAPLLEKRLIYSSDLDFVLDSKKALTLLPIVQISSTLIDQPREDLQPKVIELNRTLDSLMRGNGVHQHLPYAEKLYYAYKYNTLVRMHLAISEVTYMNADPSSGFQESHSQYKCKLIDACMEAIENGNQGARRNNANIPVELWSLLKRNLGQRLWFENCNEQHVKEEGANLFVGNRMVRGFKGSLAALSDIFKRSLKVFSLIGNQYQLLHTITDLQDVILQAILDAESELSKGNHCFANVAKCLTAAVKSKNFRIHVSNFCSDRIGKSGIDGKHLNWADVLLFKQTGGHENIVLDLAYGIDVSTQQISGCHTPYQFLERLLEKLQTFDSRMLHSFPKILIATPGGHAWTLSPHCWSLLLDNKKGFFQFVEEVVFRPAKYRLSSFIPYETIVRIIEKYTDVELTRNEMKGFFRGCMPLTYSRCLGILLDKTNPEKINLIEKIIEEEFSVVLLSNREMTEVLRILKLDLPSSVFSDLMNAMPKEHRLPYELARTLRMLLIEKGVAIFTPYEIEHAICKIAGLPQPIKLGDLNWVDTNREDPYHPELEIKYSWVENTPHYCIRYQDSVTVEPNSKYRVFILHHPKLATKVHSW
jgi:hypothetical protein